MSNGGGMSEEKDPAIKLFGKTITLTENGSPPLPDRMSDLDFQILENADPKDMCRAITKTEVEDGIVEESGHREKSSVLGDDKKDKTPRDKDEAQVNTNLKEDNTEVSSTGEENVLKKPDKVLPCPRCSSFDTKFCYFNNYNVNQPRHYCRNCQRYWTAGGTMRKVPVGAGRRKNKQLSTQHSQILVPIDALPSTRDASPHLLSCDESPIPLKRSAGNKNLPIFCLEKTPCQSMETVSLRDQKSCANICSITKTTEEPSHCGSLMTSSSVHEDVTHEKVTVDEQCVFSASCNILRPQHGLQCYPIPQWDSPWNPCIPMQFVPAPYWGLPYGPVRMGNIPLAGSSNNSQTLDKHSRDEDLIEVERSNKRVIVPKTLRLDDPDEASKSTVWETLGFKPCVSKPPETGTKSNGHQLNAPAVLEANPVALCRSQTFQEST